MWGGGYFCMGSPPGPTPLRALWRAADPLLPPTRIALTAAALGPAPTIAGEQAVPQPPLAVAGPRVTVARLAYVKTEDKLQLRASSYYLYVQRVFIRVS